MANTTSAKRRVRRNDAKHVVNRNRMSRIRTFVKNVELAILSGDKKAAETALQTAQPEIQRGVSKGIIHKNTAARKISRISARIKALASKK